MGFNGLEAGAEGPLSKKTKASYLLSYRYSTLALFKALGFSATGAAIPYYQDWTARINLPLSAKTTLAAYSIGGASHIDFLGNDADTLGTDGNLYGNENENTLVDYFTTMSGITLTHQHNNKVYSKLSVGLATTNETFEGDSISVITRQAFKRGEAQQKTNRLGISYLTTTKFNTRTSLTSGLMADLLGFNLFNREIFGGGTSQRININTSDNTVLLQAYSTLRHRFNNRITLNTGLHVQQLTLNSSWAVEPRVGLRYKLNEAQSLSLGYGLHSQMQNIYTYFVQTPTNRGAALTNKNLDFTRSHHLVLGYDWAFNPQTRLKAETYYQSLFNVPVEQRASSYSALNTGADFGPDNTDSLANNGSGANYGLEMTVERSFHRGFYALVTVSIFNSRYKGSDGVERNTAFNTGYVANMLAGKEWIVGKKKAVLGVDLRLSTQGGRYLSPIDATASAAAGEAVYKQNQAYSQQQPAYFRADVKLLYRRNFKHTALETSLDLQNITNRQNVFLQQYNRRTNSIVTQYQQGFFPVPTVRFTF
ncbi:MAG: hypothetical protein EAY75_02325 [Bacteroidetes bacterium]|nr:MAG: hypothetical protein EAY75_02325 [Bacteroidota bacterium]